MPTVSLTQLSVERVKPPAKGRVDYFDKNQPGFGPAGHPHREQVLDRGLSAQGDDEA